jgi:hypothetical protein
MKLKFLGVLLLVCLMAASTFAATTGAWIQDPCEGTCSGNWTNPAMWKASSNGRPPVPTTNTGDEIKLNGTTAGQMQAVTTINSFIGGLDGITNYNCKLTVAGGANTVDVHTVLIQGGASMGVSQFQVGHGNSTDKGKWGAVEQTGGTVNVEKLMLATYGTRGPAGVPTKGTYIISGGTLQTNATISGATGRLLVGAGITTGATSANNEGVFTVVGTGGTISMKELYVGGYSTYAGTGTMEFQVGATGVSAVQLANSVTLDLQGASSVANLVLTLTAALVDPTAPIVLVKNGSGNAVAGFFDHINGVARGAEGSYVGLSYGGIVYGYQLTYLYNADGGAIGNDIALVIPEPATLALLSLGLLVIRRRK